MLASIFEDSAFIYIAEEDDIGEIVRLKSSRYSHIIACGGDGTVNSVVRGLMNSKAVLGVLPLGSGNDFAKQINLSADFHTNVEILKKGNTCSIDVIESNAGLFVNTFGIGLDGLTNFYATQSLFKRKSLKYFAGGLRALFHAKPFTAQITVDEKELNSKKVWMVTIANGRIEGGRYNISPTSISGDGVVELIVVKAFSRGRLFWEFIKLSFGFSFKPGLTEVHKIQHTLKVKLNREMKVHADGEQVAQKKRYNFKLNKQLIDVIC